MTITFQDHTRWRGRTVAAVLLAAAATVAGMVGAPAPAHAADQYIALALGYVNENPPVTMAGGSAISASPATRRPRGADELLSNGGPLRDTGDRHERVRSGRLE